MDSLFVMDWSFMVAVVLLAFVVVALTVRARKIRRKQKREEKRRAKRAYNAWLADSNMQPLDDKDAPEAER